MLHLMQGIMNLITENPVEEEIKDSRVLINNNSPSPLLDLPPELRDQIWSLTFENRDVSGPNSTSFHQFLEDCEPCYSVSQKHRERPSIAIESYRIAWRPLTACKQIYQEAAETFYNSMTMTILTYGELLSATRCPLAPREKVTKLALYIHATDDNRHEWMALLSTLNKTFPRLKYLSIHNHMRPPVSHDNLVDAVYIAGPLATLPDKITQTLYFAYLRDETMFEEARIGRIRTSDAIEEHEMVIRDTIADPEFRRAAAVRDLNGMATRLLDIAQRYQETWLQKLYERRFGELTREGFTEEEAIAYLTSH